MERIDTKGGCNQHHVRDPTAEHGQLLAVSGRFSFGFGHTSHALHRVTREADGTYPQIPCRDDLVEAVPRLADRYLITFIELSCVPLQQSS